MCDVTSDTDTLTARRLDFVRTLESGSYEQCSASIFTDPLFDYDYREISPASYCCIGVGRDVMEPGYFFSGDYIELSDPDVYHAFRIHYGIGDDRLVDHLIALNDARGRNFPFIARFLRKVWGLTGA